MTAIQNAGKWIRPLRVLASFLLLSAGSIALADGPEGRWRNGSWTDNNTGHQGPLRGHFRQTNDGNYRAVFTGRFFAVIPFRFATTLQVVGREGDQVQFAGESKLALFSRYTYSGTADGQNFNMQYQSRQYQGDFNLSR